jgi:hypothetical protein
VPWQHCCFRFASLVRRRSASLVCLGGLQADRQSEIQTERQTERQPNTSQDSGKQGRSGQVSQAQARITLLLLYAEQQCNYGTTPQGDDADQPSKPREPGKSWFFLLSCETAHSQDRVPRLQDTKSVRWPGNPSSVDVRGGTGIPYQALGAPDDVFVWCAGGLGQMTLAWHSGACNQPNEPTNQGIAVDVHR